MKRFASIIFIITISALFAFECGDHSNCCVPPLCSESFSLTGSWKLKGFQDETTGTIEENPNQGDRGVMFTFKDNNALGTLSGHTVSNEIMGGYQIDSQCAITFTTFGGTKVGENGWSSKVWIPSGTKGFYQIAGNTLTLYFTDPKVRMVFVKV